MRAPTGPGHLIQATDALILRRTAYRESDLILSALTQAYGRISLVARGARKSQRRFAGALEPMHTITVDLHVKAGAEIARIQDATLSRSRLNLVSNLERLEAAGRALRWLERGTPLRNPEATIWDLILSLLDDLDERESAMSPSLHLAAYGLLLLKALGWGARAHPLRALPPRVLTKSEGSRRSAARWTGLPRLRRRPDRRSPHLRECALQRP